jgi:membrane protein required for beta-lactamase induction
LVGSHHLHLLHALVLHHLHLLLLAHDTRGRHLLSHSRIRHVGNVTRISHGTLLSSVMPPGGPPDGGPPWGPGCMG